jgi:hypothetical protein
LTISPHRFSGIGSKSEKWKRFSTASSLSCRQLLSLKTIGNFVNVTFGAELILIFSLTYPCITPTIQAVFHN